MECLLREMAGGENGQIVAPILRDGREPAVRHHHVRLLIDAGHAAWLGDKESFVRITNDGYDGIAALDKNPDLRSKFNCWIKSGLPYVKAVGAALSLVPQWIPWQGTAGFEATLTRSMRRLSGLKVVRRLSTAFIWIADSTKSTRSTCGYLVKFSTQFP